MSLRLAPAPPIQACATFYAIVGFNDVYWRIEAPAKAVGAKTVLLPENAEPTRDNRGRFNGRRPAATYSIMEPNDDSEFPWEFLVDRNNLAGWEQGDPDSWEIRFPAQEGDCAIWTRPDLARATIAAAMRYKLGWRTLAEVDDNYLTNPRYNLSIRSNPDWGREHALQHLKAHASMTGIVFSTAWLRDRYVKALRRRLKMTRRTFPELHVCGNHVDHADWPTRADHDGPVRVGWMGSDSHVWDINLAYPVFEYAHNELGCETWMVGYNPAKANLNPEAALFDEGARRAAQWGAVVDRHIPWVKPGRYHRFPLPFDIGVAPLLENEFTLGKSDVKAVEYLIAGAAPVLWDVPVYSNNWIHGETCLLAKNAYEAGMAVQRLVKDENLRERIVKNGQDYIRQERGLKQLRAEWGAAING